MVIKMQDKNRVFGQSGGGGTPMAVLRNVMLQGMTWIAWKGHCLKGDDPGLPMAF